MKELKATKLSDLEVAPDFKVLSSYEEKYYDGCDGPYYRTIETEVYALGQKWQRQSKDLDRARDIRWVWWEPSEWRVVPSDKLLVTQWSYSIQTYPDREDFSIGVAGTPYEIDEEDKHFLLDPGESLDVFQRKLPSGKETWYEIIYRGGSDYSLKVKEPQ